MTKLLKNLNGAKVHLQAISTPTLKHTWRHTLSLYPSTKSKRPVFSVSAKDDKTVSVLKLALILLGGVCVCIAAAALVKRIREKIRARKRDAVRCGCDDCPWAQIEE